MNRPTRTRLIVLLLILCACNGIATSAQDPEGRSLLYISAGASVPYSDFNREYFSFTSGFALPGGNLEAHYMLNFGGFLGISARVGYASLCFNEQAYRDQYYTALRTSGEITTTSGNYHFLSATGGFFGRFPEFLNTRIILYAEAGYSLCLHPELTVEHSDWGRINYIPRSADLQFTGNAGVKIHHSLNERFGIHLGYSLTSCLPDFEVSEYDPFYLPVRFMNINAGFVVNL